MYYEKITPTHTNFLPQRELRTNKFKFFKIVLFFIFLSGSCIKDGNKELNLASQKINELLNSKTLKNHLFFIKNYGEIDYPLIKYQNFKFNSKENIDVFSIPLIKEGKTIGRIEAVDLGKEGFLPNNDRYAMNFLYFDNFDFKNFTGKIAMFDLNYDNFNHTKISFIKSQLKSILSTGLNEALSIKYNYLDKGPERKINQTSKIRSVYSVCDEDKNKNISYSECYRCIGNAIAQNEFSTILCDVPSPASSICWSSRVISCLYVSAKY
jgi:hypothetical protein